MSVAALTSACVLSAGCGGGKTEGGKDGDDGDTLVVDTSDVDTPGGVVYHSVPLGDARIRVWMDGSASMEGYVSKTADMTTFNGLLAALSGTGRESEFSMFGKELEQATDYATFSNRVAADKFVWSDGTDLTAMIDTAAATAADGSLVCLLTDGILSTADENIGVRSGVVKENKTSYAEILKKKLGNKKNLSVNVSQYFANFSGDYYRYDNSKERVKANRPLYLITIGADSLVRQYVDERVKPSDSGLHTVQSVTFGDVNMPYKLPMTVSGDVTKSDKRTYKLKQGCESVKFRVNVSSLQDYMKDEAYLNANGHLEIETANGYMDVSQYYSGNGISIETEYKDDIYSYTVPKKPDMNKNYRFTLNYSLPEWTRTSSTDDDKEIYSDTTTFLFTHLIEGLSALNQTRGEAVNDNESTIVVFKK